MMDQPTEPANSGLAMNISRITGATVMSLDGEDVGRIDDVVVDTVSGRLTSVVIGVGGIFHIGEQRYEVPWESVRYVPGIDAFVLKLAKDEIQAALGKAAEPSSALQPGDLGAAA